MQTLWDDTHQRLCSCSEEAEGGMKQVHVIPVPEGMTPEEAFAEIEVFGQLAEDRWVGDDGEGGGWAVIEVDDAAD